MLLWIPPAEEGDVASAIGRVVSAWLGTWIVEVPALVCNEVSLSDVCIGEWHGPRGGQIAGSPEGLLDLGLAALSGEGDLQFARDHQLALGLADTILDDLTKQMSQMVQGTEAEDNEHYWHVRAKGGAWAFVLRLGRQAQIRFRQHAAGRSRDCRPRPLLTALNDEVVTVGGHLGFADLTARDLATLAVSDVIVFNRVCADPVPATVNGMIAPSGRIKISPRAAGVHVTVADPIALQKD